MSNEILNPKSERPNARSAVKLKSDKKIRDKKTAVGQAEYRSLQAEIFLSVIFLSLPFGLGRLHFGPTRQPARRGRGVTHLQLRFRGLKLVSGKDELPCWSI